MDRNRNQISSFIVGPGTVVSANRLLEKIKNPIKIIATDENYAYNRVIPRHTKHLKTKSETCLVESFNARLRHYIPCLRRRSMHYAKTRWAIIRDVEMWINQKQVLDYV